MMTISYSNQSLGYKLLLIIYNLCFSAGCRSDSDCPSTEACINRECKDPCIFETCGTNALCRVTSHRAQCVCLESYEGDPYRVCRLPECLVDKDCSTTLACRNKKCQDPCNCAPGARCVVNNHIPQCSCPPGYQGDPAVSGCSPPGE